MELNIDRLHEVFRDLPNTKRGQGKTIYMMCEAIQTALLHDDMNILLFTESHILTNVIFVETVLLARNHFKINDMEVNRLNKQIQIGSSKIKIMKYDHNRMYEKTRGLNNLYLIYDI